jgi:hypothetical protein
MTVFIQKPPCLTGSQGASALQAFAGCGTKFHAGFAFHFEAPGRTRSPSLKFSRQLALNHIALVAPKPWRRRAKKNIEKFTVLVFP